MKAGETTSRIMPAVNQAMETRCAQGARGGLRPVASREDEEARKMSEGVRMTKDCVMAEHVTSEWSAVPPPGYELAADGWRLNGKWFASPFQVHPMARRKGRLRAYAYDRISVDPRYAIVSACEDGKEKAVHVPIGHHKARGYAARLASDPVEALRHGLRVSIGTGSWEVEAVRRLFAELTFERASNA